MPTSALADQSARLLRGLGKWRQAWKGRDIDDHGMAWGYARWENGIGMGSARTLGGSRCALAASTPPLPLLGCSHKQPLAHCQNYGLCNRAETMGRSRIPFAS